MSSLMHAIVFKDVTYACTFMYAHINTRIWLFAVCMRVSMHRNALYIQMELHSLCIYVQ